MNLNQPPLSLKLASIFSIGLRVFLLGGKLLFMLALARYSSPSTVGVFALVVTISTILVYVVGAEVHTYTTREIVGLDSSQEQAWHVQNHLRFVLTGALLSLPFAWLTLWGLHIDLHFSFFAFSLVLIGEVVCQELGRYLLALSQPIASSILQFVRGAAWIPFAVWGLYSTAYSAIDVSLYCWAVGCAGAAIFGIWRMRQMFISRLKYSWAWQREALGNARFYFVVAVFAQVQNYADRFVVQYYLGEYSVGLLAFYQGIANTIMGFVQTGVIGILLPKLIHAVKRNEHMEERAIKLRMLKLAMGIALVMAVILWAGMAPVLSLIGRNEYNSVLHLLTWLLLGNILLVWAQISHLHLYAHRRDKELMWITIVLLPVSLFINMLVVPRFGLIGAVVVFAGIASLQAVVKSVMALRYCQNKCPT